MRPVTQALTGLCVAICSAAGTARAQVDLSAASYAIGADIGRTTLDRLSADGVAFELERVVAGFRDALSGAGEMSEAEVREALQDLEAELRRREVAALLESDPVYRALHAANQKRSEAFLAAFAAEDGVQPLAGGVLLMVDQPGAGATPQPGDKVVVSFEARNLDGDVVAEGQSVSADLGEMIEGSRTVLTSVPVGTSGLAVMPPEAAFGEAGRPPEIGPNEVLWFRFTLEGIDQ